MSRRRCPPPSAARRSSCRWSRPACSSTSRRTPMYKRYRHIHFVGIGGVGMSGIAEILVNMGYTVTGSDQKRSETIERLQRLGAQVYGGHEAPHPPGPHVLVLSSALAPGHGAVPLA